MKVCVFGMSGSGKSHKARAMLKDHRRVLVIDPSRDWERQGFGEPLRGDGNTISAALAKGIARKAFCFTYCPPHGRDVQAMAEIARALMHYQLPYMESTGKRGADCVMVMDEAAALYPNAAAMRPGNPVSALILQGRHYGIGLLAISQRPADVALQLRSQAQVTHAFKLVDESSVKAVRALHMAAAGLDLPGLPPRRYYSISGDGVTGPHMEGK